MYRLRYAHPISSKECSRVFKDLYNLFLFVRSFSCSICFEIISINVNESQYYYYDLFEDVFIYNLDSSTQKSFSLEDVKND